MANHQGGAKGRKRKLGVGNIQSATVLARPVAVKTVLSKTMPEKVMVVKPHSAHGKVATARLVNSMDLDEMLEMHIATEIIIIIDIITARNFFL